ncbi:unnamed protein product [Caretta caretta]
MGTWCLLRLGTILQWGSPSLPWAHMNGKLKYISYGWWGCCGVNTAGQVWFHWGIWPDKCMGTYWVHIPGTLTMIETGTDGSVYRVNS